MKQNVSNSWFVEGYTIRRSDSNTRRYVQWCGGSFNTKRQVLNFVTRFKEIEVGI